MTNGLPGPAAKRCLHALQAFFGTDEMTFYVTSSRFPGELHYFNRFSDAISELIEARIWAGLHVRTADEQAATLGQKVARYTRVHYFEPPRSRRTREGPQHAAPRESPTSRTVQLGRWAHRDEL